jgi:hypothetical protein
MAQLVARLGYSSRRNTNIARVIVAVVAIAVVALTAAVTIWRGFHLLVVGPIPLRIYGHGKCVCLPVVIA